MAGKRIKRNSEEVDKLIAEVDRLAKNGMSVNKACTKVGLQTTVYYFRKRKVQAEAQELAERAAYSSQRPSQVPNRAPLKEMSSLYESKDLASLTQEYRELENRMNALKLEIAEKVMSGNGILK